MTTSEILTAIDAQIARLQQARNAIASSSPARRRGRPPASSSATRQRREEPSRLRQGRRSPRHSARGAQSRRQRRSRSSSSLPGSCAMNDTNRWPLYADTPCYGASASGNTPGGRAKAVKIREGPVNRIYLFTTVTTDGSGPLHAGAPSCFS